MKDKTLAQCNACKRVEWYDNEDLMQEPLNCNGCDGYHVYKV